MSGGEKEEGAEAATLAPASVESARGGGRVTSAAGAAAAGGGSAAPGGAGEVGDNSMSAEEMEEENRRMVLERPREAALAFARFVFFDLISPEHWIEPLLSSLAWNQQV